MARARSKKERPPPTSGARWVLFMPSIPAKPASVRVKIWRRLQAIGAVGLRGSLYALPNREECVEVFEWLSRELRELGGQASICEGRFLDETTDDEIERRFIDARSADYAEIATAARQLGKQLEAKRLAPERIAQIAEQHGKLVQRLGEVAAIDFMHVPSREAVEGLLAAVARALPRDGASAGEPLEVMERPSAATWVTRTGVHVDRIASAWLIRRFIDPAAAFKFVPAKGYAPRPGELRFDMFEAEFTHVGDRCTFETLLDRFSLTEPALHEIAEIVHDIDLKDAKFGREDAAGIERVLAGIAAAHADDEARLARGSQLFDELYALYGTESNSRL